MTFDKSLLNIFFVTFGVKNLLYFLAGGETLVKNESTQNAETYFSL